MPESALDEERIAQQMRFLLEADKLKLIERRNLVADGSRRENSAEHSWHIALMALVLTEYAEEAVDLARVVRMLVVHDLVEIHAGDTFLFDPAANLDKSQREQASANALFGLLPLEQAQQLRALWDEFEERQTPEARFAAAIDSFQPILQNWETQGGSWRANGVTAAKVLERKKRDLEPFPRLWAYAQKLVKDAVERGYIRP
jgi:putative hydrolase of HD superfamily